jgi:hypothetical protein
MSSASVTQLLAGYDKAVAPIKRAEAERSSSFRGASIAREPGIQQQGQTVVLDSGSAPSVGPGMTNVEFAASAGSVAQ